MKEATLDKPEEGEEPVGHAAQGGGRGAVDKWG